MSLQLVRLNKILSSRGADMYNDNEEGEGQPRALVTTPVMINPETVRCITPRKHDEPGSRITFSDGGGFALSEDFETATNLLLGRDA